MNSYGQLIGNNFQNSRSGLAFCPIIIIGICVCAAGITQPIVIRFCVFESVSYRGHCLLFACIGVIEIKATKLARFFSFNYAFIAIRSQAEISINLTRKCTFQINCRQMRCAQMFRFGCGIYLANYYQMLHLITSSQTTGMWHIFFLLFY